MNTKKAMPTTTPTPAPAHHPAFRAVNAERARELAAIILGDADDERIRALIELVAAAAYSPELGQRDTIAMFASMEAFRLTAEYTDAETKFCLSI